MNISLNMKINSGTALVLWVVSFFGVLFTSKIATAVADNLILVLAALTTGMGGYLVKRNSNNKIALTAETRGLTMPKDDPLR